MEENDKCQLLVTQETEDIIYLPKMVPDQNSSSEEKKTSPGAESNAPSNRKDSPFISKMKSVESIIGSSLGGLASPRETPECDPISRKLTALENSYISLVDTSSTILDTQNSTQNKLEKATKESETSISCLNSALETFIKEMRLEMKEMRQDIQEIKEKLQQRPLPKERKAEALAPELKSQLEGMTNLLCQQRTQQCATCDEKITSATAQQPESKMPTVRKKHASESKTKQSTTQVPTAHKGTPEPPPPPPFPRRMEW